MPSYEGLVDWRQHQGSLLLGLAGVLLIAFGSTTFGFLVLISALLYSGYTSDGEMKEKSVW